MVTWGWDKIACEINEFQIYSPMLLLFCLFVFSFHSGMFFVTEVPSEVWSPGWGWWCWEKDLDGDGPVRCWGRSLMEACPVLTLHLQPIWVVLWCVPMKTPAAAMLVAWEASLSPLVWWPAPSWSLWSPDSSTVSPRSIQECIYLLLGVGATVLFMFLQKLYLNAKFTQHLKWLKLFLVISCLCDLEEIELDNLT